MISFITGCTNNKPPEMESIATYELAPEVDNPLEVSSDIAAWIELPNINIEPGVSEGVTKAETETSSYEFYGRAEAENIILAHINEIASFVLKHEYDYSPPKGRLLHFIQEEGIWVGELSLEVQQIVSSNGRTVINSDSVHSVGALFYGSSRNLIPAWLSAGLELYWSDRFGFERIAFDKEFDVKAWQLEKEAENLPAFGDVWFELSDDKTKLSVAFSFVQWLDENELLKALVISYLDDKQAEGDLLFADAWLQFTGQDIHGDFFFNSQLRYLYGYYLQTFNWDTQTYDFDDFAFSALTDQAYYFFDWWFWGDNIFKDMEEFINSIDTQYAYAKQWLGFDDAAPIQTRVLFSRGGGMSMAGVDYVAIVGNNPLVAVHEAIHHLLAVNNISEDFYWFWEGLPEGLQFIYSDEDPEFYGAKMLLAFADGNVDAFIDDVASRYHRLTGKEYVYNGTFNFKQFIHIEALEKVLETGSNVYRELYSYDTAASFAVFLLDLGSKEDFMRLYVDTSVAEELYGKDFNSLYEQWLEFLKQL